MDLYSQPKTEDTNNIKDEENSQDISCEQMIKKEETTQTKLSFFHGSLFIRQQNLLNTRFEQLFESLNQYLENFIEVEDFEIPFCFKEDKGIQKIISNARTCFRNWGSDVINTLIEDLQMNGAHHTFPDIYLVQVVETTKRRIFSSYKHLKKIFMELLAQTQRIEEPTVKEWKQKKFIRKNKYDFPHEAQALLRLWFVAHAQDPYPSHEEKIQLAKKGGISMKQLDNWFTNTRGRIWKQTQKLEPNFQKQIAEILLIKTENFLNIPL